MVAMGNCCLSQKAGVDPQKVVEAIKGGAAQCWTLDVKPARLFAGNRTPGFKAHMQAKDLNIILETAREYGIPLPSAAVDAQLYNAMLQNGMVTWILGSDRDDRGVGGCGVKDSTLRNTQFTKFLMVLFVAAGIKKV